MLSNKTLVNYYIYIYIYVYIYNDLKAQQALG